MGIRVLFRTRSTAWPLIARLVSLSVWRRSRGQALHSRGEDNVPGGGTVRLMPLYDDIGIDPVRALCCDWLSSESPGADGAGRRLMADGQKGAKDVEASGFRMEARECRET